MKDFCLKQGQGLMATAAHLFPKFRSVLPPPPAPHPNPQPINATCKHSGFDFLNHYWANKLAHNSLYRLLKALYVYRRPCLFNIAMENYERK